MIGCQPGFLILPSLFSWTSFFSKWQAVPTTHCSATWTLYRWFLRTFWQAVRLGQTKMQKKLTQDSDWETWPALSAAGNGFPLRVHSEDPWLEWDLAELYFLAPWSTLHWKLKYPSIVASTGLLHFNILGMVPTGGGLSMTRKWPLTRLPLSVENATKTN